MRKPRAQAAFKVSALALGDGQIPRGPVALQISSAAQALHGVQDGPRSLVVAGETANPGGRTLRVDLRRALWGQGDAAAEAAIDT